MGFEPGGAISSRMCLLEIANAGFINAPGSETNRLQRSIPVQTYVEHEALDHFAA